MISCLLDNNASKAVCGDENNIPILHGIVVSAMRVSQKAPSDFL